MGADSGLTMATIFPAETEFPNPMFNNWKDRFDVPLFESFLFNVLNLLSYFLEFAFDYNDLL